MKPKDTALIIVCVAFAALLGVLRAMRDDPAIRTVKPEPRREFILIPTRCRELDEIWFV